MGFVFNPFTGTLDSTTSLGFLDSRYLKLDTSNDPLTGDLRITYTVPNNTSSTNSSLFVLPTLTLTTNGTYFMIGQRVTPKIIINTGVTNTSGYLMGQRLYGYRDQVGDVGTITGGTFPHIIGQELLVGHANNQTGAVTDIAASQVARLTVLSGTVNSYRGFYIQTPSLSGGTLGVYYGMYQEYTSARNWIAGRMSIGADSTGARLIVDGVSDEIQLLVQANATQTTNIAEFQSSAAGVLAFISGTGNIQSNGTAITLDSSGTAVFRVDRGANTNTGAFIFTTAGTDRWNLGLTSGADNLQIRDAANGRNFLNLYVAGSSVFNEDGLDQDFRVEGDTDVNLLFSDASADTVQVGAATASDSAKFYVAGKISTSGEMEINGDLNHDGTNIGFFGVAPTTRQTELTDELTTVTFSAPGTPDYAIQDLVVATGYGFVTADEAQTVLSVIANLQTRVNELETKLTAYGLLIDAD